MTETRAQKAQRLVDEGRVDIWGTSEYSVRAYVAGEDDTYLTITFVSGRYFCECEWGKYHSYTDDLCAHALAVKLAVERKDKTC